MLLVCDTLVDKELGNLLTLVTLQLHDCTVLLVDNNVGVTVVGLVLKWQRGRNKKTYLLEVFQNLVQTEL